MDPSRHCPATMVHIHSASVCSQAPYAPSSSFLSSSFSFCQASFAVRISWPSNFVVLFLHAVSGRSVGECKKWMYRCCIYVDQILYGHLRVSPVMCFVSAMFVCMLTCVPAVCVFVCDVGLRSCIGHLSLAERDGQLQVFLFLLSKPLQSFTLCSLTLSLSPLQLLSLIPKLKRNKDGEIRLPFKASNLYHCLLFQS